MISRPDINELLECMRNLADAMNMDPLPSEIAEQVFDHILFDGEFRGISGKDSYECLNRNIITEREYRNLLVAHCATKISSHNKKSEPSCDEYFTQKIANRFEKALLGRLANLVSTDILDSWEK